jgi:hypothetical protein
MSELAAHPTLNALRAAAAPSPRIRRICSYLLIPVACATSIVSIAPAAETYPSKPIRLILRSPPGGADDLQARLLAAQLSPILGQQVVVDYHPGAGGLVAWEYMAKAPPDGYAIMLTASGLTSVRALRPSVKIDPWRDYTWISEVSQFMLAFTGRRRTSTSRTCRTAAPGRCTSICSAAVSSSARPRRAAPCRT